ncbi:MAG TPA: outer membrane protein assembly factor BamA [Verrucomicrobiae bacterium]|nr:outer membrane protein assembly factor BamA [Verrucomicrobiae bacterium]
MLDRRRLLWFVCVLCLALGGAARPARAQVPGPQLKVSRITLTNIGPSLVSVSLIRANIRVKEGDTYNQRALDDDVLSLYATGYFLNINILVDRLDDGIGLVYVLQARPKITDILFTGNTKFSKEKLAKNVKSKSGEPMDEAKLFADAEAIRKLYEKAGHPKTKVVYVPNIDTRAGRAAVTFEITETPKVRVVDVQFEGAQIFTQSKLRKQLKTKRHWWLSWLTRSGVLKEDQLEDDQDRLAEFYRDAGYIDFELKEVQQLQQGPRKVLLKFVISEGRKYKVGAVEFKGVTLFTTNELTKRLKMGVGETFTPKGLYQDTEAVQDTFGTKGYIDARVAPRRRPNTQTGTMDIRYEVTEGEQAKIEKIEIRGNTKTKDRVIRRELTVYPGQVFDMVNVKISKARLEGLQYFEKVETQPEETDVPSRRNLVISVAEKNTGNVQVGAGFSSIDALVGYVEVSQANFDLFNPPNFTGGGQRAKLRLQVGTQRQDYQLTLIEPWLFGRKLELSTKLFYRDLNYLSRADTYSERDAGFELGLRKALLETKRATLIAGVSYTLQQFDIDLNPDLHGPITKTRLNPFPEIYIVPANVSEKIAREEGTFLESKVGASLSFDTRNSYLFATKGQKTDLRAEIAGGVLGGDVDIYKLELRHSRYIRGFFEGHLLELGARTGVADKFGNSDFVPIFERYFLGGLETLRGYRYRDVGPQDEFGEPLGGDTFWFGTAEYSVPVIERIRFALFYDIGMVYEKPWHINFNNYADNWGFGLRLNLPIGPLRLDYGIPIHNSSGEAGTGRFQFSVGYQRDF